MLLAEAAHISEKLREMYRNYMSDSENRSVYWEGALTVIRQMMDNYKGRYDNMPYKQMDVRDLTYDDDTFHAVIDKGTFDSVCCGDAANANAKMMCDEISRAL